MTATPIDVSLFHSYAGVVKHAFPSPGPNARPIHIDVNGRKGRRAVCVLYGDGKRYDVLDLDAEMEEEDGDVIGEEEVEGHSTVLP